MTNISYIENIDRFADEGSVVVWLNKAGREALNCENAYEINSRNGCANIEWSDLRFGEQHIEFAPGGSEDARILEYMLDNPESAIEDILHHLEQLNDTPDVTDIRRGFVDNSAALLFKINGVDWIEWLDDDNHNHLESTHTHLDSQYAGDHEEVWAQLKEWLADNKVLVEWSNGQASMLGGEFDTLAEAEAALESVKSEFFAQCETDEDRANLEAGEFRIVW
ncbi:hypothetical protein D7027_02195 [Ochrobactrum intermedium]|uniref:hypothetical protein n=1 Tax=Brucella intermedia TaxID=94625 RepID=UPI00128D5DE7|nr:hypothetical protein [Brucella intermedia]MPR60643.1 hypothetical protein [Brucella intermedia]